LQLQWQLTAFKQDKLLRELDASLIVWLFCRLTRCVVS
jgi:hypothetical protein